MDEINEKMGTLDGIQIRAEAKVHEYFYNNVQVCSHSIYYYDERYMKQDTFGMNNELMKLKF